MTQAAAEAARELPATRRRLPRAVRRENILNVATQVFYAKGYDAASLQDIADVMGIKKASLFYYFASKEELLHAVLARIISKGRESARRTITDHAAPLTRIWLLVAGHMLHLCENLEETAVYLHERGSVPSERRREILQSDSSYRQLFIDTIIAGKAAGQMLAHIDPKLATHSILGSANWTYTWYRRTGEIKPQDIGRQFATMTVNSLATPQARLTWTPPTAIPAPARAS